MKEEFIAHIAQTLELEYFNPGDYVIEEGTLGDKMYFISSGKVEAVVNGVAKVKLGPGLFFGGK